MEPLADADPAQVGEFRLLARLGSGGMGHVFLAASPAGRLVAVKIIHADLTREPRFVTRFRSEVAAASTISGLYTAPLVAAGADDGGIMWLATAFLPGPSLDDIVSGRQPLALPALWRLAAGLAEALQAIHATGLVHRDLKPENVMITLDGPRVIDFGIARRPQDARLTAAGMVMGTPAFISPEGAAGLAAGPSSDVFSLGAVLAFAASGEPPFSGGDAGQVTVLYRVTQAEPDLSAIPAPIRGLIAACLAKEPLRRPSLAEVGEHVAKATANLDLPLGAFWPPDLADAIKAEQAAQAAQLQRLRAGSAKPAPVWPHSTVQTASLRNGAARDTRADPDIADGGRAARGPARRRLLVVAGAAGVAAAGGLGGWTLAARRPGRSRRTTATGRKPPPSEGPQPTLPKFAGVKTGQTAWMFTTAGPVTGSPAVAGGVLYAASADGFLYAYAVGSGMMIWNCYAPGITAAPTVAADVVCAEGQTGTPGASLFYAIDVASGKLLWSQGIASAVPGSAQGWVISGNNAIVAAQPGGLRTYDALTGTLGVTYTTAAGFTGTAAGGSGTVYALDHAGRVHAISLRTGRTRWRTQVLGSGPEQRGGGSLTVAGGTLYVGAATGGRLFSLHAGTGQVNWAHKVDASLESAPVIVNQMVYITGSSGLFALTAADAAQVWTGPGSPAGGAPAVAAGVVYVCDGSKLQALDARTGAPGWSFTPPAAATGTPAVADGLVFFGCQDHNIYAIRA